MSEANTCHCNPDHGGSKCCPEHAELWAKSERRRLSSRELPVGATFETDNTGHVYRVISKQTCKHTENGREYPLYNFRVALLSLPAPATPPTEKRPPCDACGEESCPSRSGVDLYMTDNRAARLCFECWHKRDPNTVEENIRARRAQHSDEPVALGTLQAGDAFEIHESERASGEIVGCYGVSRVVCRRGATVIVDLSGGQRISLLPRRKVLRRPALTQQSSGSGDAATRKDADSAPTETLNSPQPEEPRWQTKDPARISALEAQLAEQVRAGGHDTEYSRRKVEERASLPMAVEIGRRIPHRDGGIHGRIDYREESLAHGITAGPVLNLRAYRPRERRKR